MLNNSMRNPPGATVAPFHMNYSSNRSHNGNDDHKMYKDAGMHLHGSFEKSQGDFCKK